MLATSCVREEKKLNPLCTIASVMRRALLFCQSTYFSIVTVESNSVELINLLNSNRLFSLEIAWIFEYITPIRDSFDFIYFFF